MQIGRAVAGAGIGTWQIDFTTGTVELSRSAADLIGTDRITLSLDAVLVPIHASDRAAVAAAWRRSLRRHDSPQEIEFRAARMDSEGHERWLLSRGVLEREAGGAAATAHGILIDVTARRQAEQAMWESEARFQDIANAAPVLIWISDTSGRCTWFNRAWLSFTGRTMEQERGDGWTDGVHPDDKARCVTTYAGCFERREPFRMDYRLRRADGTWRITDDTGVPRFTADGRFVGYIGSVVDVTEAREAAAELRRLNETLEARIADRVAELAAVNRQLVARIEERERAEATMRQMQRMDAVGQITAGVAHDFNNLLAVIIGNVDHVVAGLDGRDGAQPLKEMLCSALEAAEKGASLTAQLIAFARRQKLDPQQVDLNQVVGDMRDLLQTPVGGLIALTIDLPADLWPALADQTQLALVILNLAINARDAMPDGGTLTIATFNLPPDTPGFPSFLVTGDYVVVAVTDTGIGMTEEVKARAFEPFFTTKPVGRGSGLGLSQVYGFAKQSNGGVLIDTAPGAGTTVRLLLPRATGTVDAGRADQRRLRPIGLRGGDTGHHLLIVDDDPAVREVTAMALRRLGYEVITAGSGRVALDLLSRADPLVDLMVVDFAMPGMNGIDVSREARVLRPDLPVLFVTGYADMSALAGIDPSLIMGKPYRDHDLADRVAFLLQGPENQAVPSA